MAKEVPILENTATILHSAVSHFSLQILPWNYTTHWLIYGNVTYRFPNYDPPFAAILTVARSSKNLKIILTLDPRTKCISYLTNQILPPMTKIVIFTQSQMNQD